MKKRNVRAPKSIDVIRLRPGQFIGDNSTANHLIHECIDNFLDELRNNFGSSAGISFSKAGEVFVYDNGRGLPFGETIDEESGKKIDSIELLFTKLHSGTKFSLDDDELTSLFGQNGVGLVAVNALSEYVDVKTKYKDEVWHYFFKDGILTLKEKYGKPITWATEIIFKPSLKYFESITPNHMEFYERLKLAQCKIPSANFIFNSDPLKKEELVDFVRTKLNLNKDTPIFNTKFKTNIEITDLETQSKTKKPAEVEVFLTYEAGDTIINGDVNLRFCEGTFLTNTQALIKSILPLKLDKKFQKAPDRFLIEGLRMYISLQYPTPKFDSQTKTRFVSDVKSDIIAPLESQLSKILSEPYIKKVVESILSQKLNSSISKSNKSKISSDNKLRDCTNKPGDVLYILEGDSAESVFRECRYTDTEANLPLNL